MNQYPKARAVTAAKRGGRAKLGGPVGEALRAVGGAVKARYNRNRADSKLVGYLNKRIGSSSIVGGKNFRTHRGELSKLVRAGKQPEAAAYATAQAAKVRAQLRAEQKSGASPRKMKPAGILRKK